MIILMMAHSCSIAPIKWFAVSRSSPSAIIPCKGLQCDLVLLDRDGEMVGVKHSKVPKEFLHLVDHLPQIHLCQVLQPKVLNPVGENCAEQQPFSCFPSRAQLVSGKHLGSTSFLFPSRVSGRLP